MKKVVLMLSAAAALAACSKNEVVPATVAGDAEITWLTAPKSKAIAAGASRTDFDHANVFASYAYALKKGETWAANYATAEPYISGATISYVNDVWKNADAKYFWPKEGSLTFFAWSINNANLDAYKKEVSCTPADGIKASLDVVTNENVDFMVADMQADKTAGVATYDHNGVPTLFRHRLSDIVFKVRTDKDYSANKTIGLNYIKFTGIASKGEYSQLVSGAEKQEIAADATSNKDQYYRSDSNDAQEVKSGEYQSVENVGQHLYLPQEFVKGGAKLVVGYTVTTKKEYTGGDKNYMEELEQTIDLKDLFGSWEMGKRYTFNLSFSLDEILWDPAVENWDEVASGDILIEQ